MGNESSTAVKVRKNFIAVASIGIWGRKLSCQLPGLGFILSTGCQRGVWGLSSQLVPIGLHTTEAAE